MLMIRLTRKGKKNQPFFRIVVIDKKRSAKGGRAVEILGYIDPLTKRKSLKKERILHWLKNGAQPSDTMHNVLVSEKIIEGRKIHVARIKKTGIETSPKAAAPVAAKTPVLAEPSAVPAEKPAENSLSSASVVSAQEKPEKLAEPEKTI